MGFCDSLAETLQYVWVMFRETFVFSLCTNRYDTYICKMISFWHIYCIIISDFRTAVLQFWLMNKQPLQSPSTPSSLPLFWLKCFKYLLYYLNFISHEWNASFTAVKMLSHQHWHQVDSAHAKIAFNLGRNACWIFVPSMSLSAPSQEISILFRTRRITLQ